MILVFLFLFVHAVEEEAEVEDDYSDDKPEEVMVGETWTQLRWLLCDEVLLPMTKDSLDVEAFLTDRWHD